ncbi:hypothetical protein [Duganella sp.]|uniref:hypothetical protein n=1 Tax=Duganella sp. TaxID=1904440 RepID=UPI0031D5A446
MDIPAQAAPSPQPQADASPPRRPRGGAPQSWMVRVADAKYYWYDLLADFADKPDIRDPIGRYLRRMEFELDATAAQRHLFLAVTRPRVRFDIAGALQWGYISLKLTLPLLLGAERRKDSITVELTVPPKAALKKPTITLTEAFLTLNWGNLVEVFSVHDLLRTHAPALNLPSQVVYVGQTRDPEGRLGKGRLPAMQQMRAQFGAEDDTLLLVLGTSVEVQSAARPAPHPLAADAVQAERVDVIEAALIRYFAGSQPPGHSSGERRQRSERITAVQQDKHLVQYTIDLALPADCGSYNQLGSELVSAAPRHLLSCFIADGQAQVASMPLPTVPEAGKS